MQEKSLGCLLPPPPPPTVPPPSSSTTMLRRCFWPISLEGGVLGRPPGSRGGDGELWGCAVLSSVPWELHKGRGREGLDVLITPGMSPLPRDEGLPPHHWSVLGQGLPQGTFLGLPKNRQS